MAWLRRSTPVGWLALARKRLGVGTWNFEELFMGVEGSQCEIFFSNASLLKAGAKLFWNINLCFWCECSHKKINPEIDCCQQLLSLASQNRSPGVWDTQADLSGACLKSHRLAFYLANDCQPFNVDHFVSHLCHTKKCIKLSHLSLEPALINNRRKSCCREYAVVMKDIMTVYSPLV